MPLTKRLCERISRQAGIVVLRTEPLGSDIAWVGVLVAGWHEADRQPTDAKELMAVIACMLHAAILLGMQSATAADLQRTILQLEAEVRSQF